MAPRKRKPLQASTSTRRTHGAQDVRNNSHSRAVKSASAVEYDGRITRFRASLSRTNVSSLPLEVLGEIFILALPTAHESYRRLVSIDHSPRITNPLVFCAVCSSWRSLAFSMPQLWKRVHIFFPPNLKKAQARKMADLLIQWIERSHPLPLTLYVFPDIERGVDGLPSKTGPEAPILSILDQCAGRWKSIYCHSPLPFGLDDRWESLQLINLRFPYRVLFAAESGTSPWAQLTYLQIQSNISYREADTIFMKCPKLVQLSISVNAFEGTTTAPRTIHNLVTFSLRLQFSQFRRVVQQLSLPSLREFSIKNISPEDVEPLMDFFTRSNCVLDMLDIQGSWWFAMESYPVILSHRSFNLLSSLVINPVSGFTPADGNEILRRLTLRRNGSLCTHLKFLTINYSIPSWSSTILLDMVKSRICPHDESMLQYLQFRVEEKFTELDEVGVGSGLDYSCTKLLSGSHLVRLQRPGSGKPPNLSELIYEI